MAEKWKLDNSKQFVNPYNFVRDSKEVMHTEKKKAGKLSGRIDCVIKTKEAICLPDREDKFNGMDRCYDFYNIDGQYLIPGSTIRGCIRSVFETVTNSCYLTTADSDITVRMKKPRNTTPGILRFENGNWVLYKAKYKEDPKNRYSPKYTKDTPGTIERKWRALPAKTDRYLNKSFWFKQLDRETSVNSDVLSSNVNKLKSILEIYKENNSTEIECANEREKSQFKTFEKTIDEQIDAIKEEKPNKPVYVFYEIEKGKFKYFSPAAIGRHYSNSVYGLLKNKPCNGKDDKFCPACRLFGTVTDKNENLASSLRFSDALPSDNDCIRKDVVLLNEMSTPKISSMEFYSFLLTNLGIKENIKCWGYDDDAVSLRGRKYYFHSKAAPEPDSGIPNDDIPDRQIATRPSKAGSEFRFSVWFDKINEEQLSQLCWAITLGENDINGKYMHKIGTARPFGYGSAKIAIESLLCRSFDCDTNSYSVENKSESEIESVIASAKLDETAKADLRIITNYDFLEGKNVHYPIADDGKNSENSTAGFHWFMANRTPDGKFFTQVLPQLDKNPDNLVMYGYIPDKANGNYGDGKQNGNNNRNNNGEKKEDRRSKDNTQINRTQKPEFVKGKTYTGKTTGCPKNFVYIKLDNGEKTSVFKEGFSPDQYFDTKVEVIYKGKNDKGYDAFDLVKVIS